jgi:SAM-dependent methyltransferase
MDPLLSGVARYYAGKLAEHGETPRGVDWNGSEGQELRFEQLCKLLPQGQAFSINDLGCGYGALYDHIAARHQDFSYAGWDVSQEMVDAASARHRDAPNARFAVGSVPGAPADYSVASGIFNVRLDTPVEQWRAYVLDSIAALDRASTRGFAFNSLTAYSDEDKMRPHLYYPDPCELFALCKRRYARNVALLHDYGLYEFTILVRKVL